MRKTTALVLALALILSIAGCSSDTMRLNVGKASRLELISGVTGRTVELNDAGSIRRISDNINSLEFARSGKLDSGSWSYALKWFADDGSCTEKLTVIDSRTIVHSGSAYTVLSPSGGIDLDLLKGFLEAHF